MTKHEFILMFLAIHMRPHEKIKFEELQEQIEHAEFVWNAIVPLLPES